MTASVGGGLPSVGGAPVSAPPPSGSPPPSRTIGPPPIARLRLEQPAASNAGTATNATGNDNMRRHTRIWFLL
jgi:hypothetical protein